MATKNRRAKRTIKRKTAENNRRRKIRQVIDRWKAELLMLKIEQSAGCGRVGDGIRGASISNLIVKYEAILTEDRR